eukprot:171373-Rhodomonas_salina.2
MSTSALAPRHHDLDARPQDVLEEVEDLARLPQLRRREPGLARKRAADELLPVQPRQVRPELVHAQPRAHFEVA